MTGYLTPKQAAEYCGLHYRTFLALAREQGLRPAAVFGARNRYTTQQLDTFGKTLRLRAEQTHQRKAS